MCLGTQPPSAESAGSSLTGLEREGVFRLWSPLNEAKSIFSVSEIVARARNGSKTGMCCGAGGAIFVYMKHKCRWRECFLFSFVFIIWEGTYTTAYVWR